MSDFSKLVIFGSFTEEETRKFQKKSVEGENSSVRTPPLQFGSLDFSSVFSHGELNSEAKGPELSQKPQSPTTPNSSTKDGVLEGKKTVKVGKAKEVSVRQSNGRKDMLHPRKNLLENGKTEVTSNSICLPEDSRTSRAVSHDGDADSSRDITESSSESEFYMNSPVAMKSNEESSRRNTPKLSNEQAVNPKPLLPCGLINSGNLCFLNATLQAFLACSPFVKLLQNLRACDIPKIGYSTVHAFVEFISNFDMPDELISKMNEQSVIETGASFVPGMFETVLKSFTPDLDSNMSNRPRQEDAQEFLSFVMHQLHDELLKLDGHLSNSTGGLLSLVSSQEDDGWETVGPRNKSAVTRTQSLIPSELTDIFGGELKSIVKARGNKSSSDTVQPFLLLHLDILPDAVNTIQDALHLFCAPETLEGYKTSGAKAGVVSASKSVKIQKLSKIMILHLMRFSYGSKGSAKLNKPVHFPLEFDIGRELLVSPSSKLRRKYELVATITHHGRDPSKGHYTADVRYSNGKWLHCDDASVTIVPISKVLHDQAYVLFYKQV